MHSAGGDRRSSRNSRNRLIPICKFRLKWRFGNIRLILKMTTVWPYLDVSDIQMKKLSRVAVCFRDKSHESAAEFCRVTYHTRIPRWTSFSSESPSRSIFLLRNLLFYQTSNTTLYQTQTFSRRCRSPAFPATEHHHVSFFSRKQNEEETPILQRRRTQCSR